MGSSENNILGISEHDKKSHECYFSSGQELNMEIVNQFGQFIGEFSRLDHELWLTSPDDDDYYDDHEPISVFSDGFEFKHVVSHSHEHGTDQPMSEFTDNTVADKGLTSMENNSLPSKFSSQNQSQALSPNSILQRISLSSETTIVMKRPRSRRSRPSRSKHFDTFFESKNHWESFVLEETTDSCPTKLLRTRKVSDLLQNPKSQPANIPQQDPQMEVDRVVKKCFSCDSAMTCQSMTLRYGSLRGKNLCNACGIQYKKGLISPKETSDMFHSGSKMRNRKHLSESTHKRKVPTEKVKKCQHCESSKTPQWREGPMGRNTLCNACGVQYRNRRLFPEYRPLRSPTYDPSLHSHLPKKVHKMRLSTIREEKKHAKSGKSEQQA